MQKDPSRAAGFFSAIQKALQRNDRRNNNGERERDELRREDNTQDNQLVGGTIDVLHGSDGVVDGENGSRVQRTEEAA
jgi:hypothetical protein